MKFISHISALGCLLLSAHSYASDITVSAQIQSSDCALVGEAIVASNSFKNSAGVGVSRPDSMCIIVYNGNVLGESGAASTPTAGRMAFMDSNLLSIYNANNSSPSSNTHSKMAVMRIVDGIVTGLTQ